MKLTLVLILLMSFVSGNLFATNNQLQLCSSSVCNETANFINDALNTSVNPCDNFYAYACSGWNKYSIPADGVSIDNFSNLTKIIMTQIKNLLVSFNVSNMEKQHSAAITLSASVFQKCMNASHDENILKETVKAVVGGWHVGQNSTNNKFTWSQSLVQSIVKGGTLYTVFSLGIGPSTKNASQNIIWVCCYKNKF